jgi:SAM-dependent methyltransferase
VLTVDYERLGARPGELLLDLGAGNGRHAYEAFRRGIRVVAADFNHADMVECRTMCGAMEAVGEAPAGGLAAATVADGQSLPFPDATFDRIIAAEVMEHIPDDEAAAAELARVLKPGGTVAVTVPSWLPEVVCWKLSDEYHAPKVEGGHVRIYTEAELRRKLAATAVERHGGLDVVPDVRVAPGEPGDHPGGQLPLGDGLGGVRHLGRGQDAGHVGQPAGLRRHGHDPPAWPMWTEIPPRRRSGACGRRAPGSCPGPAAGAARRPG